MDLKKSVVSWNFCAMSKQVSPLSTPTTVSHSGVDLALVPISISKINTKKCQYFIEQTPTSFCFLYTIKLSNITLAVALQKAVQIVNADNHYNGKKLNYFP